MPGSRLAPFTGVLFVVLYVAAWMVMRTPSDTDSPSTAAAYYTDSNHRVMMIVSAYLFIAAAFTLLGFFVSLRGRLIGAEGGDAPLTTLAFGSGAVAVALMIAGAMAAASVPGAVAFGSLDAPADGDLTRFIQQIGFGMILVGAMLAAAVAIAASSLVTLRTGALPAWTAWLGFVAAVVLLFAVVWLPQVALLIWVLAVGLALRAPARASAPQTA